MSTAAASPAAHADIDLVANIDAAESDDARASSWRADVAETTRAQGHSCAAPPTPSHAAPPPQPFSARPRCRFARRAALPAAGPRRAGRPGKRRCGSWPHWWGRLPWPSWRTAAACSGTPSVSARCAICLSRGTKRPARSQPRTPAHSILPCVCVCVLAGCAGAACAGGALHRTGAAAPLRKGRLLQAPARGQGGTPSPLSTRVGQDSLALLQSGRRAVGLVISLTTRAGHAVREGRRVIGRVCMHMAGGSDITRPHLAALSRPAPPTAAYCRRSWDFC